MLKNLGGQNASPSTSTASLEKTFRAFRTKFFQGANDTALGYAKGSEDIHQTAGSGIDQLGGDQSEHAPVIGTMGIDRVSS